MTTIPDSLPFLSWGSHESPAEGACIMEYVSILAGEKFSDTPACTDRVLGVIAQNVNDSLESDDRQKLLPLIPELLNTAIDSEDNRTEAERWEWIAQRMLPFASTDRHSAVNNFLAGRGMMGGDGDFYATSYFERSVAASLESPADEMIERFSKVLELWREDTRQQPAPIDLADIEAARQDYIAAELAMAVAS